uniref:Uncharacterized protein n=1 Tax=Lepeophtheirus salmonis TaxID=72036 RepID=A0A0K2U3Q4_LEPSM
MFSILRHSSYDEDATIIQSTWVNLTPCWSHTMSSSTPTWVKPFDKSKKYELMSLYPSYMFCLLMHPVK